MQRLIRTHTPSPRPAAIHRPIAAVQGLLLAAVLVAASSATAQQFVVAPSATVLSGDPLHISLTGLPASGEVSLTATRLVRDFFGNRLYRAEARFAIGTDGRLDLATQAPADGSYAGADLRGLFWSMTPLAAAAPPAATASAAAGEALSEGQVRLVASSRGRELAQQLIQFRHTLPEVIRQPVDAFPGAIFAVPPGKAKRPALILLGGSEGGSSVARSAQAYAARGFAVLGLPYYSPPGWGANGPTAAELPQLPAAFADIPIERLEQARAWLATQPQVDATRIGVLGISKGAEFALAAAQRLPWIRAVVALVPTDVIWEGWGDGVLPGQRSSFAWQGQPLAFVPYKDFAQEVRGFQTGEPVLFRRPQDKGRAAFAERVPAARIRVEDITAPVLVAGGDDDQVWDSGGMARNIAKARAAAGRETVLLVYPKAGHALSASGWSPTTQYNAGPMKMGGTPQADARAQAEIWTRSIEFLRSSLGPMPD